MRLETVFMAMLCSLTTMACAEGGVHVKVPTRTGIRVAGSSVLRVVEPVIIAGVVVVEAGALCQGEVKEKVWRPTRVQAVDGSWIVLNPQAPMLETGDGDGMVFTGDSTPIVAGRAVVPATTPIAGRILVAGLEWWLAASTSWNEGKFISTLRPIMLIGVGLLILGSVHRLGENKRESRDVRNASRELPARKT